MIRFVIIIVISGWLTSGNAEEYERNKAVPVQKVLFGEVLSVRRITEQELIIDKDNGWNTFGGALVGGIIGHQFGGGSGQDIATVLGAIIGASIANDENTRKRKRLIQLVELMIKVDGGDEFMVVQDYDHKMVFSSGNAIRMIYLANGSVRIDKQL